MDSLANSIKKFDGTGFEVWSTLIKSLLIAKDLAHVLTQDSPAGDAESKAFRKQDEQAKAILLLSLDPSIVTLVLSCGSAKQIWNRLKEVHSQQSVSCKMVLYQQFYGAKMQPGTKVSNYVADLELIAKKLRDIGVTIDDDILINKIVSGLSPDFKHFMSNWMATAEKDRTYANLLPRLMAEESMMVKTSQEEPVALKASTGPLNRDTDKSKRNKKNRTKLTCHYCSIKGHIERDCRKKKRDQASSNTGEDGEKKYATVAKALLSKTIKGRFYFDSGASYHMTNDREWLDDYKTHERPIEIIVGNNESVYAMGSGSIDVISIVDGEKVHVTLMDVQYVPAISDNLFSQGAADRKGHSILTKGGKLSVMSNGKTLIQGTRNASNMYVLDLHVPLKAHIARSERTIEEWHRALGHPNINEIKNLAQKGCAKDLKIVQRTEIADHCGDCPAGKCHHVSHPDSHRERSSAPLHRVHVDLVGPVEPPTLNRARYFLLIKDEYSSFLHVYFLRTKDETLEKLRSYVNEASIQSQSHVRIIRSDNGSEFKNKSVSLLCQSEGIIQELSAPRTPQQNGEIERANRTILEAARTLLHSSGLPLNLWGEAVLTSVYLRNRLTNSRNRDKTPFELFHGKPPSYSHLIEFGKELQVLDTKRGSSKFSSKTLEVFMVGYGIRTNTYRCYDPRVKDIIISSDIVVAPHKGRNKEPSSTDRPFINFPIRIVDGRGAGGASPRSDGGNQSGPTNGGLEINRPEISSADVQQHCASIGIYDNIDQGGDDDSIYANIEQSGQLAVEQHQGSDERRQSPAQVEYVNISSIPTPSAPIYGSSQTVRQSAAQAEPQAAARSSAQTSFTGSDLPRSATLRRVANYANLPRAMAPIVLSGRGTIITTPASATASVTHVAGPSGQHRPAPSQGGRSTRDLINRISTALHPRDREKNEMQQKYAHLAVANRRQPVTYAEAMSSDDKEKWQRALADELAAHAKNHTWSIVPKPTDTREISVKWVFTVKTNPSGEIKRYKVRNRASSDSSFDASIV